MYCSACILNRSKKNDVIINFTFGHGYCKIHGGFSFYNTKLKIKCENCAEEKNICQLCGGEL